MKLERSQAWTCKTRTSSLAGCGASGDAQVGGELKEKERSATSSAIGLTLPGRQCAGVLLRRRGSCSEGTRPRRGRSTGPCDSARTGCRTSWGSDERPAEPHRLSRRARAPRSQTIRWRPAGRCAGILLTGRPLTPCRRRRGQPE
eukprot:752110-Hanusia_phi.AAC.4